MLEISFRILSTYYRCCNCCSKTSKSENCAFYIWIIVCKYVWFIFYSALVSGVFVISLWFLLLFSSVRLSCLLRILQHWCFFNLHFKKKKLENEIAVYRCLVSSVNGCGNRGVPASYSSLLESARVLCADILMSQQQHSGYASLRKSCMDLMLWTCSLHVLIIPLVMFAFTNV